MLSGSRKVCKRPLQQNIRSAAQRERLQAEEFRLITSNLVQRSILCVSFSTCEKTLLKEVPQDMYTYFQNQVAANCDPLDYRSTARHSSIEMLKQRMETKIG